jgi:hypothetical protein
MTKYTITTRLGTAVIDADTIEAAKAVYAARYSYDFDGADWHWITDDGSDGDVDFRNIQNIPWRIVGY